MKKSISAVAAFAAAVMISFSASAADIPMKRLGKTAEYASSTAVSTAELLTSRSVKNTLVIKPREAFIVPAGKKLVLKAGCKVQGTLYIQQGGILSVSGGKLDISGSVINDGTISIGSKAKLDVRKDAMLYTSADGSFKSNSNYISVDLGANVACLGSSSIKGGSSANVTKLVPTPVSGKVITTDTGNVVISSETISVKTALSMINVDYSTAAEVPAGYVPETTVLEMENGGSIEVSFVHGEIAQIGNAPMRYILRTADLKDPVTDYSEKLAAAWEKKWQSISKDGMATPKVSVFTYEMSDGSWFVAMIYPSYQNDRAVFYRLAGGKVTELAESSCGLDLTVLKKGSEYILRSTSTHSFISGTNGATSLSVIDDYYKIGKTGMTLLGSFERHIHGDEITYTGVLTNGDYANASFSEYNGLQEDITRGSVVACHADFDNTGDLSSDYYLEFTKRGSNLAGYIADRLYTPERENVVYYG